MILVLGIAWIGVVFFREFASLKTSFAIDSGAWLLYTVVAGCAALLFTAPIFRELLDAYVKPHVSLVYASRLLFVAQILRHLPGRIWGVMYLVNQTYDEMPAASMVRANVDLMLYSTAFNLLVAGALVLTSVVGPLAGVAFAAVGIVVAAISLRQDWVGGLAGVFAKVMPSRFKSFASAVATHPSLPVSAVLKIVAAFVLVWVCYLSIWWALPKVFGVLQNVDIWLLCASYMLAWVIGYLSMITPGGLGVREAGFVALASPLMGLPELTFLAVFIRLWQIFVEALMFLAFAFTRSDLAPANQLVNDSD